MQGSGPPTKKPAGRIFREIKVLPRSGEERPARREARQDFFSRGLPGLGRAGSFFAGPMGPRAGQDFFFRGRRGWPGAGQDFSRPAPPGPGSGQDFSRSQPPAKAESPLARPPGAQGALEPGRIFRVWDPKNPARPGPCPAGWPRSPAGFFFRAGPNKSPARVGRGPAGWPSRPGRIFFSREPEKSCRPGWIFQFEIKILPGLKRKSCPARSPARDSG